MKMKRDCTNTKRLQLLLYPTDPFILLLIWERFLLKCHHHQYQDHKHADDSEIDFRRQEGLDPVNEHTPCSELPGRNSSRHLHRFGEFVSLPLWIRSDLPLNLSAKSSTLSNSSRVEEKLVPPVLSKGSLISNAKRSICP